MKLTQPLWRTIAAATLTGCGILAWIGAESQTLRQSPFWFAVYWFVFMLLFLITIGLVLWDLRYIRLQYLRAEREAFRETLADESFRSALQQAHRKKTQPRSDT